MKEELRSHFPMLQRKIHGHPFIYFDTAATAQKPQVVIDALSNFYMYHYATVHRAVYTTAQESTHNYSAARLTVQNFLHAAYPEEIIFTRGATASLNLLARSFGKAFMSPGDAVILSAIEHHSNIVPWQMLREEKNIELRIIPVNDRGELILEEYEALLDDRVKLVSIAHLSHVVGTLHSVEKIIEAAHRVGAYVCLDGAQAAGHIPLNVKKLDVDFYAFSAHKIYGPTGLGVLYGKRVLLEKMPPIEGGGDMIERVSFEKTTYNHLPLKFEAGTPLIAEAIGCAAAINYLTTIGMENVYAFERGLCEYALQELQKIPSVRIIGTAEKRGGIISFVVAGIHSLDLAMLLDCQGIAVRSGHHCSQPAMERFGVTAMCRISFGIYNTYEEIDRFVAVLSGIISNLGATR